MLFDISRQQVQKLTPQFVLYTQYIGYIDSHCPYLLSGENTFHFKQEFFSIFFVHQILEIA